MKNLKIATLSLLLSVFCFSSLSAQGLENATNYQGSFYCYCAGEYIDFDIDFNEFMNNNKYHANILSATLTGANTGFPYHMVQTQNIKFNNTGTINFRMIGPTGILTNQHSMVNTNKGIGFFRCYDH